MNRIIFFLKKLKIKFQLLLNPTNSKIIGKCLKCGSCCKSLHLIYKGKIISSENEFEKLREKFSDYRHFEIVSKTKKALEFRCKMIDENNKCSIYKNRPIFCRKYPKQLFHKKLLDLSKNCGFSNKANIKFKEILNTKK